MNAVNRNVHRGTIVSKMHVTAREFARCILIDGNRVGAGWWNEEGYNVAWFDFSRNASLMHFYAALRGIAERLRDLNN